MVLLKQYMSVNEQRSRFGLRMGRKLLFIDLGAYRFNDQSIANYYVGIAFQMVGMPAHFNN